MAELAYAADLKSVAQRACGFESHLGYQSFKRRNEMEQIILNSLERAEDQLENFTTKEDLARYIADELKRAIAEQLMEQLNHL